jgi:cytochrome c peroxidase
MKTKILGVCGVLAAAAGMPAWSAAPPLGLPPVPVPQANPQSPEKIALGEKLFNDKRFSTDGTVACATCHKKEAAFTDSPLKTSEGIGKQTGTRNAPTAANAAFFKSLFWDGREPDLEGQAGQPFLNPIEMGNKDYEAILKICREDPEYQKMFMSAFKKSGNDITIKEVTQAIASFERTLIFGSSPFDRFYFGGEKTAMNEAAIRGLKVYLNEGRCVSCHTISQTHATFTDNKFHNIGVGFQKIEKDVKDLAKEFSKAKAAGTKVDVEVLSNKNVSEMGRFAVSDEWTDIGAFKTPTLRNIEKTAPYMHDGSLKDLEAVVDFYNNGGKVKKEDKDVQFLSGGIKPLDLKDQQKKDLVEFLKALTSPEFK